jgi:riboflavin synthase
LFTGLVQALGKVIKKQFGSNQAKLRIGTNNAELFQLGDSIAVNGICLTVSAKSKDWFETDVMPKTIASTNLQAIKPGEMVNLEPALRVGDALGGHFVTGHVDGVGRIESIAKDHNAFLLQISIEPSLSRYLLPKGSIAIDGVSLTLQKLAGNKFWVSLIPHTYFNTRFQYFKSGDLVNVELDMLAKQAFENAVTRPTSKISIEFLQKHGFI